MTAQLPLPQLDASYLGAHRLFVLTDEALFDACGVRVAFTSRAGGVSEGAFSSLNCGNHVGDNQAAVMKNREIVLEALSGNPALPLVVPSQVHGTEIVEIESIDMVSSAQEQAIKGADGLIVRDSSVAAMLNFADCLPLILVAPSGDFAVVHAGWRGARARIASKAARILASSADDLKQINAYVGPFIHSECFEVSQEIAQDFKEEFGSLVLADNRHVDLFGVVKTDLIQAGLLNDRIVQAGVCTQCNADRYFSYRATQGNCGRHSAVAVRL